jgi:hypothetical protein
MAYATRSEVLCTRAARLVEVAALPDGAYINALDTAALLNTGEGVLANWRSKRVGPRFVRLRGAIRYQLGALKAFAEGRDDLSWDANSREAQQKIDRQLAGDRTEAQEAREALAVHHELPEHLLESSTA